MPRASLLSITHGDAAALLLHSGRNKLRGGDRKRGSLKELHNSVSALHHLRWRTVCIVVCAIAAAGEARADAVPPEAIPATVRFEAAVRIGVGLTFETSSLNSTTIVAMPVGLDVGARINGRTFVGAFFKYGLLSSSSIACNGTCTTKTGGAGVEVLWHPLGSRGVDPWFGVGTGYAWTIYTDSAGTSNDTPTSASSSGWEVVYAQFGFDFALGSVMKLGPYAGFSLTEYVWNVYAPFTSFGVSFGVRLAILP
jgi:hypothetical protein